MDKNDVNAIFEQETSGSIFWKKFKGSEFVNYLVNFVSQVAVRARASSVRLLQESFLSSAVVPSSILAHALSKGYVPLKRTPTVHDALVTNTSNEEISIPSDTTLYSPENDLTYIIFEPITIAANSSATVRVTQGYKTNYTETVKAEQKHYTVELEPQISEELTEFSVYVTEANGIRTLWERTHLFRNTLRDSLSYVEYYSAYRKTGIRFGNNLSGRIPSVGSLIEIEAILTNGFSELPIGAVLEFDELIELNNSLIVSVSQTVAVGADREDIESIRNNALYYTSFDNNLVLDGDYPFFLRQNFAGLTWVSIWGEKEQEVLKGGPSLDYINKIYVAAYHPAMTQESIKSKTKEIFDKVTSMSLTYVAVECKESPYTLTINGKTRSTNIPANVKQTIYQMLESMFSSSAPSHLAATTHNKVYKAIEDLDLLYDFTVELDGGSFSDPVPIDTFRFLDVSNSTINITY